MFRRKRGGRMGPEEKQNCPVRQLLQGRSLEFVQAISV